MVSGAGGAGARKKKPPSGAPGFGKMDFFLFKRGLILSGGGPVGWLAKGVLGPRGGAFFLRPPNKPGAGAKKKPKPFFFMAGIFFLFLAGGKNIFRKNLFEKIFQKKKFFPRNSKFLLNKRRPSFFVIFYFKY